LDIALSGAGIAGSWAPVHAGIASAASAGTLSKIACQHRKVRAIQVLRTQGGVGLSFYIGCTLRLQQMGKMKKDS
jgi:hypothetical protein